MAYTWMTYLVPRCSGLAINGGLMEDGHTRILRNYEFGIDEEDKQEEDLISDDSNDDSDDDLW